MANAKAHHPTQTSPFAEAANAVRSDQRAAVGSGMMNLDTGGSSIQACFDNAELIDSGGSAAPSWGRTDGVVIDAPSEQDHHEIVRDPVVPLGHDSGVYHIIPPSGQLRSLKAEGLESGRGVRALFAGTGEAVEEWCPSMFPSRDNNWCQKAAGLWIIEKCNGEGVFDPSSADLRSIGVWRDDNGNCAYHCGDQLFYADGRSGPLTRGPGNIVVIGGRRLTHPVVKPVANDEFRKLWHRLDRLWGWKRTDDSAIWLGWVAAASLGGFPEWRSHLYVHGNRGSGKSKLIELAASLLGDLAGDVMNDATEAGVRQSRNNQARPLLIDEFEPDENPRTASRHESLLALFRRMSSGGGGRAARGSADHTAVSFRTLGAVYVTSINHIHLEPQDRSRFAVLELQALPDAADPIQSGKELDELVQACRTLSGHFRGRMLAQSCRWDRTHKVISSRARSSGADARQATQIATILAGYDLLLHDGEIGDLRLSDLDDLIRSLLDDAAESEESSEGRDVLDYLLSASLPLDHGIKRTTRELISAVVNDAAVDGAIDPSAALKRHGIYVNVDKHQVALRTGRTTPTARLFAETKWRNGAHVSALRKLAGVEHPSNPVRVAPNEQHRVLLVTFECLGLGPSPSVTAD